MSKTGSLIGYVGSESGIGNGSGSWKRKGGKAGRREAVYERKYSGG